MNPIKRDHDGCWYVKHPDGWIWCPTLHAAIVMAKEWWTT